MRIVESEPTGGIPSVIPSASLLDFSNSRLLASETRSLDKLGMTGGVVVAVAVAVVVESYSRPPTCTFSPAPLRTTSSASSNEASGKVWVTICSASTAPAARMSIAGP